MGKKTIKKARARVETAAPKFSRYKKEKPLSHKQYFKTLRKHPHTGLFIGAFSRIADKADAALRELQQASDEARWHLEHSPQIDALPEKQREEVEETLREAIFAVDRLSVDAADVNLHNHGRWLNQATRKVMIQEDKMLKDGRLK